MVDQGVAVAALDSDTVGRRPAEGAGFRIPSLDGLRAISIGLVLLGHCVHEVADPLSVRVLADLANLGVRVFFVISGYLITTLLAAELAENGRISIRRFYLRRAFRIFPAFYAFWAAMAIGSLLGKIQLQTGDLWQSATHLMNYHEPKAIWLGHTWSLSAEEQFYLVWPVVLMWLGARRSKIACLSLLLIAPAWRLLSIRLFGSYNEEGFVSVADGLAVGCLLACAPSVRRIFNAVSERRWFWCIPSAALVVSLMRSHPRLFSVGACAVNAAIAVAICRFERTKPLALNNRFTSWIGRLSYSLYLWQQPVMFSGIPVLLKPGVSLMLAWASSTFVEGPFRSLRVRLEQRRRLP